MNRALALVALLCAACGARQQPTPESFFDDLPPPELLSPHAAEPDFVLRQHVTARWATGETEFDAVVQKHEGALRIVALSPTGQPGFVITLDADLEVHVENRTDRALPFRPERILADVQKVFFPWVEGVPDEDGVRRGEAFGLEVIERWPEGRITERTFLSADGSVESRVRYERWDARRIAPRRAILTHETLGYELTVETLEELLLID